MNENNDYPELVELLQIRGHSAQEIDKILVQVRRYEKQSQVDSIMDSIGNGTLSLDALIKEALNN